MQYLNHLFLNYLLLIHEYLINYQTYLQNLYNKRQIQDFFILGENVYKGKMNALDGIPIKIDERKKKVKGYLQTLFSSYLDSMLNGNNFQQKMDIIIEYSLEIDSFNYLIDKMKKSNNYQLLLY